MFRWKTVGTISLLLASSAFAADLPKQIHACSADHCQDYRVIVDDRVVAQGDDATTYFENHVIALCEYLKGFALASTLMHEADHAMLWENGCRQKCQEKKKRTGHQWIYFTQELHTRLTHDNPELEWFIREAY